MNFKTQARLNNIYRDLVAKLGELEISKFKLEQDIAEIRGKIEGINFIVQPMRDIELEYIKALESKNE